MYFSQKYIGFSTILGPCTERNYVNGFPHKFCIEALA